MEKIILKIGRLIEGEDGKPVDLRRPVEIFGENLGRRRIHEVNYRGYQSLYRLEDGRYLIYVEEEDEYENYYRIRIATPADLDVNGKYEPLARAVGVLTRPLSLDEALKTQWVE